MLDGYATACICAVLCLVFIGAIGYLVQLFHFRLDHCFTFGICPRKWIKLAVLCFLKITPKQAAVIHYQHICNTSVMSMRDNTPLLHMVTCYVKKTSCFLLCVLLSGIYLIHCTNIAYTIVLTVFRILMLLLILRETYALNSSPVNSKT